MCSLLQPFLISISGMKNREERSKHFFDSGPLMEEDEGIALHDRVRKLSSRDAMLALFSTPLLLISFPKP